MGAKEQWRVNRHFSVRHFGFSSFFMFHVSCSFFSSQPHKWTHKFSFPEIIFTSVRFLVLCFNLLLLLPSSDYQMDGDTFFKMCLSQYEQIWFCGHSINRYIYMKLNVVDSSQEETSFVYNLHRWWNRFVKVLYWIIRKCSSVDLKREIHKQGYCDERDICALISHMKIKVTKGPKKVSSLP